MYDVIIKLSRDFIATRFREYERYFIQTTPLDHRFSILLGERGIGKTTTIIQYLLKQVQGDQLSNEILYIQADHTVVSQTNLYELTKKFYELGGKAIAYDEIHKYEDWSMELKSIYDTFPKLRMYASGSSALEIFKGSHDLSRRAIVYKMQGQSLREYIELNTGIKLKAYTLEEILNDHIAIVREIIQMIEKENLKILALFNEYIKFGFYPFYTEQKNDTEYWLLLEQNINATIESDLMSVHKTLTGNSIRKIKKLISFIARSVPFTPEWKKMKSIIEVTDDRTLKTYLKYLEDAGIIRMLFKNTERLSGVETGEKIYLSNTNQLHALNYDHIKQGTIRETFYISMLQPWHELSAPDSGDFWVDDKYLFEVGGKNKDASQLKGKKEAYLALDNIERGINNKIPLWLFGFLY